MKGVKQRKIQSPAGNGTYQHVDTMLTGLPPVLYADVHYTDIKVNAIVYGATDTGGNELGSRV